MHEKPYDKANNPSDQACFGRYYSLMAVFLVIIGRRYEGTDANTD
ncbi:hypothetical protein [Fodinibius salsisoli]|nr:hypothetical protein [Fodinibius salsisoli]